MDYATSVKIVQCFDNLAEKVPRYRFLKGSCNSYKIEKFFSWCILQNHVDARYLTAILFNQYSIFATVNKLQNVGMVEALHFVNLILEKMFELLVLLMQVRSKDFHSDIFFGGDVYSQLHLAGASHPDGFQKCVIPDLRIFTLLLLLIVFHI